MISCILFICILHTIYLYAVFRLACRSQLLMMIFVQLRECHLLWRDEIVELGRYAALQWTHSSSVAGLWLWNCKRHSHSKAAMLQAEWQQVWKQHNSLQVFDKTMRTASHIVACLAFLIVDLKNQSMILLQFRGDFKIQQLVDERLSLFRTTETGQNRTELPVNRRFGFEVMPCLYSAGLWHGQQVVWQLVLPSIFSLAHHLTLASKPTTDITAYLYSAGLWHGQQAVWQIVLPSIFSLAHHLTLASKPTTDITAYLYSASLWHGQQVL